MRLVWDSSVYIFWQAADRLKEHKYPHIQILEGFRHLLAPLSSFPDRLRAAEELLETFAPLDDLPAQLAAALTPTIEFPQHFHQVDGGWGLFQRTKQHIVEMVDGLV